MQETPEEQEFFKERLAGAREWHADRLQERVVLQEGLRNNLAAQAFAPDGRYAYWFDALGMAELTEYASECYDDEGSWIPYRIRIKAETRKA